VNKDRIIKNFNIFEFELSTEDMEAIKTLDTGKTTILTTTIRPKEIFKQLPLQ
jgi:2,5-diketo-D-gluconate reductase A